MAADAAAQAASGGRTGSSAGAGDRQKRTSGSRGATAAMGTIASSAHGASSIPARPARLAAAELLFWLLVAAAPPIFAALLGVLARFLEVRTSPPFPPLRLTAITVLLSVPVLLLVHTLPSALLAYLKRRRLQAEGAQLAGQLQGAAGAMLQIQVEAADGAGPSGAAAAASACGGGTSGAGAGKNAGVPSLDVSSGTGAAKGSKAAMNQARDGTDRRSLESEARGTRPAAAAQPSALAGLPRVPTLPGLAALHAKHPRCHRVLVLLAVACSYTLVIVFLNAAPKFVDPPIVMLVSMFTVIGTTMSARLWLGCPLPHGIVPAALVMIGGAAMVLVPDILTGAGHPGSLTYGQGWLGFGAAIGALVFTIAYLMLLQAFKYADMSAVEMLWYLNAVILAVVLPLSLIIDGTDWGAQFRGMGRQDWAALLFCSCVAHIGSVLGIQFSTWKLGAPTVSLFFGLRLVTSVAASHIILGATTVRTPLQCAGVALVCAAITAYMALQWWQVHRGQRAAAAVDAAVRAAREENV